MQKLEEETRSLFIELGEMMNVVLVGTELSEKYQSYKCLFDDSEINFYYNRYMSIKDDRQCFLSYKTDIVELARKRLEFLGYFKKRQWLHRRYIDLEQQFNEKTKKYKQLMKECEPKDEKVNEEDVKQEENKEKDKNTPISIYNMLFKY